MNLVREDVTAATTRQTSEANTRHDACFHPGQLIPGVWSSSVISHCKQRCFEDVLLVHNLLPCQQKDFFGMGAECSMACLLADLEPCKIKSSDLCFCSLAALYPDEIGFLIPDDLQVSF